MRSVTIGKGENEDFKTVETKRYFPVYMGRVDKAMTLDGVKDYLRTKNIGTYDVEILNTEKHKRFLSFKFKIPYANKEKIFDDTLWPKGLLLRKFLQPRAKQDSVQLPTASSAVSSELTRILSNHD